MNFIGWYWRAIRDCCHPVFGYLSLGMHLRFFSAPGNSYLVVVAGSPQFRIEVLRERA
jgi:hypothetical protein